jgi:long-chain acyl-CoA synthetase
MVEGTPDDVSLAALPLFHSFGQTTQMNSSLVMGATQIHLPRFSPEETLRLLQDENVTIMCGVPTMFLAMAEYDGADNFDLDTIARTMRVAISGGASLSPDVLDQFEEKYGFPIREGYGLSEASPVITLNRMGMPRKIGSVGVPIWGVDVRIVDDNLRDVPVGEPGEIIASGHGIMKGYYKRPGATDKILLNGWLHTGDVGRMDEDRNVYIMDRTTDMIIRGGENVYPREVEDTLMTHPDISIAAVIGVPDEKYGEEVKAFIVPVPSVRLTAEDVIAWAKQEMADFKCPKYVEICDSLPMNAIGKVLKKDLRKEP